MFITKSGLKKDLEMKTNFANVLIMCLLERYILKTLICLLSIYIKKKLNYTTSLEGLTMTCKRVEEPYCFKSQ